MLRPYVFAMNLGNVVFVLEFLSAILLFSFVFSQLLHFVPWVNENPHTCHAYDGQDNEFNQQCKCNRTRVKQQNHL